MTENNITAVLGIGGGSTIDASKAIAALTLVDTDNIWDLVEKKVAWHDALPVLAMPTIASTGSEMDKSCVIANVEKGVKSGINGDILRPRASFLDPTNTFSVSPKQTACGGFDIMAHLFDMNYFVNSDKYPLQFNVLQSYIKIRFMNGSFLPSAQAASESGECQRSGTTVPLLLLPAPVSPLIPVSSLPGSEYF